MNILIAVFRELAGLFIDDGSLALAILGVGSLTAAGAPLRFGHGRRSEARL